MQVKCAYYNQSICRSCQLIDQNYQDQIRGKEKSLSLALAPFTSRPLMPSVTSPQWGFRNKAKLTVTGTLEQPVIGLGGEETLDEGRELLDCPLHHAKLNQLMHHLLPFIQTARLAPYQIAKREGELKGIIAFYSLESQAMYLRFVLRSQESISRIKKHLSVLTDALPELKCISANIQPVPHALLEGELEIILTEQQTITHQLGDISFELAPNAFVQTNQVVSQKLYATAAQWVAEISPAKFTELFCGQGAFSFFIAPHVAEGLGIEINPHAVSQANASATQLKLPHLQFICADASMVEKELKLFGPQMILVNPPRRGLAAGAQMLNDSQASHLIYSSCSMDSLIHDLITLSSRYQVEKVQLFDMFPNTDHFETLVLLSAVKTV